MTDNLGMIQLLRDIRMKGAIDALLFSKHRAHGVGLREAGMLEGVGDDTRISALGMRTLQDADKLLRKGNVA